ncbi:hypothetical protein ACFL7M_13020 [Thermodesulfobacteriota bacterium]
MEKTTKIILMALLVTILAVPAFAWSPGYGRASSMRGFSGRGQGYALQDNTRYGNLTQEQQIQNLRGRDFVRLGKMTPLSGTLVQKGDEWGLKVGNTEYDIHMGPIGYRASKGISLKDGTEAKITGFVYGTDVSVATMETGGSSIVLRNEIGRPAWAGSMFSKRDSNPVETRGFARPLLRGVGNGPRQPGFIDKDLVGYDHRENLLENIENSTATAEEFICAIIDCTNLIEDISPSSIANYMEALANEGLLELIPSQYFSDEEIKVALDVVFERRTNIFANWNVFENQWLSGEI